MAMSQTEEERMKESGVGFFIVIDLPLRIAFFVLFILPLLKGWVG